MTTGGTASPTLLAFVRSRTTVLADEHEAPTNTGRGLIWRLYSISRFEQRDGGVYVELEAVALSRDVPGALRWLVDPIVRRTSRSSILVSLEKTEGAVLEISRAARDKRDKATAKSAFSNKTTGGSSSKRIVALKSFADGTNAQTNLHNLTAKKSLAETD